MCESVTSAKKRRADLTLNVTQSELPTYDIK